MAEAILLHRPDRIVDSEAVENSNNLITSGGVYKTVSKIEPKIVNNIKKEITQIVETTVVESLEIDQEVSPESVNAVSGKAVAEYVKNGSSKLNFIEKNLLVEGWNESNYKLVDPELVDFNNGFIDISDTASEDQIDAAFLADIRITSRENDGLTLKAHGVKPEVAIPLVFVKC